MQKAIIDSPAVVGVVGDVAASEGSAVSWAAIFAGAIAAIAATLILIELGVSLGLASVSAWTDTGTAVARIGVGGAIWLIIVQWLSSALGGYMAGRLRTKWTGVHTDEVFFRDTAHGFLAWCAASLIGVAVLAMGSAAVVKTGAEAMSDNSEPKLVDAYYVDMLFRPGAGAAAQGNPATMEQAWQSASQVLSRGVLRGTLTPDDRLYLGQLVTAHTGLNSVEADKQVDRIVGEIKADEAKAREAAEKARKAAAWASILVALSMAVGAFIASVSGVLGGRLRDAY